MRFIRQYWALLRMGLGSVPQRLALLFTIVIGVACAVGVLVSMLAMGAGARQEAMGNVRPDRAIIMTVGALSPMQSSIPTGSAAQIHELPGIRRNSQGEPVAVSQVLVFVQARKKVTGAAVGFALAGVSAGLTDYMPELRLTAGRMFRPGLHELIANNACARQFADFAVGDTMSMRGGDWKFVGNFDVGRSQGTCVVFADAGTILAAFGRDSYNQVNVMLESPARFTDLKSALEMNPTLHVQAKHEAEVAEEGMKQFNGILNFVSYFVGAIMAVAATLGAANCLYAIVDGRRRELATLCALGFSPFSIIASLLSESVVLALPGALLGAALAWLFFNGFTASPFGFSFHLAVTAPIVAVGVGWALAMGFIGGLLPALRAARVPVTTALRAT
jgi:putative ABC transport system permease protein